MKRDLFGRSFACIILCCAAAAVHSACVKLPRRASVSAAQGSTPTLPSDGVPRVSINRAPREELERLPGIGPALAARIVEWRGRYGPFRRPEHLMMVRGISERLFRQLRPRVTLE